MSVVILSSSSFKDLLLLFDLKVFDLFFVEAARCSTKEEKRRRLFSLKNSFFDFFVCLRSFRLLRHFDVKSQPTSFVSSLGLSLLDCILDYTHASDAQKQ